MKWIVCQIGAREHYAVARALWRRGVLAGLVTDLWVPPSSLLRRLTDAESIAGRYALELADAPVFAPNLRMLFFALQARIGRWPLWQKILAENAVFQKEAAKIIFGGALGAERRVLFSYSYAARDLFREAKRRGWTTVLGQIDPGPGEQRLVDGLRARYPDWTKSEGRVPPAHYWTEWREECELADRIVVNSEWSKSLLIEEGIKAEKIEVVPLAYERQSMEREAGSGELREQRSEVGGQPERSVDSVRRSRGQISEVRGQKTGVSVGEETEVKGEESRVASGGMEERRDEKTKRQKDQRPETGEREYPESFTKERPMRVLFLGQANVRKGIHDLVEAARLLGDGPWRFDVVGRYEAIPVGIPESVVFHGQVPRSEAKTWYEEADAFVLPTHSDGFALTQIEAMAHGLPVLTTPCCGEVVRDGVNGLIFPSGDPEALAGAVRHLVQEPQRLAAMSRQARETVEEFGIERVARGLLEGDSASAQWPAKS